MKHATIATIILVLAVVTASVAEAQPYGTWITLDADHHAYIDVPHSASLNPTSALTIEAWVSVATASPGQCFSIMGKDYRTSYWVGFCGETLRSFVGGISTARDGGIIPDHQWTHIAVVFDGSQRRHYINGNLVASWTETLVLTPSDVNLRIGSDVSWEYTPDAAFDDVRLWNVARSTGQIRASINQELDSPQTGLVAVWNMNGGQDALGNHDGALVNSPGFLTFPVTVACFPTATSLCLGDRFAVTVTWEATTGATGNGNVASCGSDDTGIFWFFNEDNWEMMVKVLNGCSFNDRWWVFFSATTNVAYRVEVTDVVYGANKIYFNYQGVASPAVTDTAAFATCP